MGFEDLEIRLKRCWRLMVPATDKSLKARVLARSQQHFIAHKGAKSWLRWRRYFARTLSLGTMSALLLGTTGVVDMPLLGNEVVGQIESRGGVVEVIRGDRSVLVSGTKELHSGDWVRVGHRGEALITTDHFASAVEAGSWLKLEQANTVFLDKGRLNTTHWQPSQVKTGRGSVQTGDGSEVAIEVSETGETRILPARQQVAVFDLNNGQILAQAGEEVVLRSDTVLMPSEHLEGISLSNAQIEAILGKFAITRTKALTGIENMLEGKRAQAHHEIMSAEQSFRSVAQILMSGRDLAITRRVNLESIAIDDVLPLLSAKTNRPELLTEAASLQALFSVLAQNKNSVAFAPVNSGVETYDRYVLLHYLASLGNPHEATAIDSLADTYVISLLRKVQQSPIRIEQLAYLNEQIDALPLNEDSERFLYALKNRLSPDLAAVVEEKLDYLF